MSKETKVNTKEIDGEEIKRLETNKQELEAKILEITQEYNKRRTKFVVGAAALLLLSILASKWVLFLSPEMLAFVYFALGGICAAVYGAMYLIGLKEEKRRLEIKKQEREFEIDLARYTTEKREKRSEKLLKINQVQLKRYYDLNLSQSRHIFYLGVFCIVLGVCIIIGTVYVITKIASKDQQLIVGAMGAIGSILTNYVAAIFLKMHSVTAENLSQFHSRLVETQEHYLSNLLVSQIKDDEKREDALKELALQVAKKGAKEKEKEKTK